LGERVCEEREAAHDDYVAAMSRTLALNRALVLPVVALAFACPAYADVTIKQTMTGKGMGMLSTVPTLSYIKGNRMRTDATIGDRTQSTIVDLDTQTLYILDSSKKEADVFDIAAFSQEVGAGVDLARMKVAFKPNGKTKEILGTAATGFDLEVTVPAAIGAGPETSMVMTLAGLAWMVKDVPGAAEIVRFQKVAAEKGWLFSNPIAAGGQAGPGKAIVEIFKQFGEAGGVAYEMDMQIKVDASAPMADILAKMGPMSFSTKVDSIDISPLADDLFAVPAGYKLNVKKN
jgi:hypothetical protein